MQGLISVEKSDRIAKINYGGARGARPHFGKRGENSGMRMRTKTWAKPELSACPYYIPEPEALRGNWQKSFGAKRPIHLDLGCGKCVFLAEAAKRHGNVNYVGIDLSYDILGGGAQKDPRPFLGIRTPIMYYSAITILKSFPGCSRRKKRSSGCISISAIPGPPPSTTSAA